MRAEKWIALCITLLILSVSVIVIVTLTDPSLNSIETTSPSQDPEQDAFVPINDEALAALFAEADAILDTHTTVTVNNNKFIKDYMLIKSMIASESTHTEAVISLNTADYPREDLQYLIFLSLITERYEGYYAEVPGSGMTYLPYFILCTEYEKSGYSTIYGYLYAVKSGEASDPLNTYKISFTSKSITRYKGFSELYPELSGTGTK